MERSPRARVQVGEDWVCVRNTQEGRGLEPWTTCEWSPDDTWTTCESERGRAGPDGVRCAGHHADLIIYSEE